MNVYSFEYCWSMSKPVNAKYPEISVWIGFNDVIKIASILTVLSQMNSMSMHNNYFDGKFHQPKRDRDRTRFFECNIGFYISVFHVINITIGLIFGAILSNDLVLKFCAHFWSKKHKKPEKDSQYNNNNNKWN